MSSVKSRPGLLYTVLSMDNNGTFWGHWPSARWTERAEDCFCFVLLGIFYSNDRFSTLGFSTKNRVFFESYVQPTHLFLYLLTEILFRGITMDVDKEPLYIILFYNGDENSSRSQKSFELKR